MPLFFSAYAAIFFSSSDSSRRDLAAISSFRFWSVLLATLAASSLESPAARALSSAYEAWIVAPFCLKYDESSPCEPAWTVPALNAYPYPERPQRGEPRRPDGRRSAQPRRRLCAADQLGPRRVLVLLHRLPGLARGRLTVGDAAPSAEGGEGGRPSRVLHLTAFCNAFSAAFSCDARTGRAVDGRAAQTADL